MTMYACNGIVPLDRRTIGYYLNRNDVRAAGTFATHNPSQCLRIYTTAHNHESIMACFRIWINRSDNCADVYGHIRNSNLSLKERLTILNDAPMGLSLNDRLFDYYLIIDDVELGNYIAGDDYCFKQFIKYIGKTDVGINSAITVDCLLWIRVHTRKQTPAYRHIYQRMNKIDVRRNGEFPINEINYNQLKHLIPKDIAYLLLGGSLEQVVIIYERYSMAKYGQAFIFSHKELDVYLRLDVLITHASKIRVAPEHLTMIKPCRVPITNYSALVAMYYKMDYDIFVRLWPNHTIAQVFNYCRPESIPLRFKYYSTSYLPRLSLSSRDNMSA